MPASPFLFMDAIRFENITKAFGTKVVANRDVSFSTAIDLFNSVVNSILLITVNAITGKMSGNSLW